MKLQNARVVGSRGSAVLIILILISAMALIILANCTTLHWLKREILRIEERQQKLHLQGQAAQAHGSRPNH